MQDRRHLLRPDRRLPGVVLAPGQGHGALAEDRDGLVHGVCDGHDALQVSEAASATINDDSSRGIIIIFEEAS